MQRLPVLILFIGLAVHARADRASGPVIPQAEDYEMLSRHSPFTSKAEAGAEKNPLDDYSLVGISRFDDGFHAVLLNRKNPSERIVLRQGKAEGGFGIVKVTWSTDSWRDTTATVRKGEHVRVIGFDKQFLNRRMAEARAAARPKRSSATRLEDADKRTPRPRRVVSPAR